MTEGDNEDFNLRLYSGTLSADVVLRVRPLTLSGFEAYRRTSSRTFAQSILDDIDDIPDPAECECYIMHCVHCRLQLPPLSPLARQNDAELPPRPTAALIRDYYERTPK